MGGVRVLHVITRLANGGAAENTIYTVNGLDRSRWSVELAIGGSPGEDETDQVEKLAIAADVPIHRIESLVRNPGLGELRALAALRRLIRTGGYTIVHTHGAKAGILGRMAAHREGVPVIINGIHGHTFSPQMNPLARLVYRTIERRVARYTTHFVPVGDDLRVQYLAARVGDAARYTVIHSGMELTRFLAAAAIDAAGRAAIRAELGIPADAVVFANISRMEPRKGHRFFLDAAARVAPRPAGGMAPRTDGAGAFARQTPPPAGEGGPPWFVIVGDGPEEAALRAQARELGIDERVVFTGYRRDVERMFAMSDVVVLTSLWEGLPRVLVQAAAAARPAISFACDGAREVIVDDENGWVVPMKDVDAVADRMGRLLADPALRERMGQAGRALVNDSWTVEAMVGEIDALYSRLLDATTAAPQ